MSFRNLYDSSKFSNFVAFTIYFSSVLNFYKVSSNAPSFIPDFGGFYPFFVSILVFCG